jgi:hypothetical protein
VRNLALGVSAGEDLFSGDDNIYIANRGMQVESKTLRLGQNQTRAFVAGSRGVTLSKSAVPLLIDSTGQLGTVKSSQRFKKDIADMGKTSEKLYNLRPVTYHYKDAPEGDKAPLEYGLIAEEVEKVYPDLVAYGADGKIETVQYHKLVPLLLNELQALNDAKQNQQTLVQTQSQQLNELKQLVGQVQAQNQTMKQQLSDLQQHLPIASKAGASKVLAQAD